MRSLSMLRKEVYLYSNHCNVNESAVQGDCADAEMSTSLLIRTHHGHDSDKFHPRLLLISYINVILLVPPMYQLLTNPL